MLIRIVISDSSCLIGLRKMVLLDTFLRLPYEFLIPNTLFDGELLCFTHAEKQALIDSGLNIVDLPGKRVQRVQEVLRKNPKLAVHHSFAFVLAESYPGCILLTGDRGLRILAAENGIEAHNVLWAINEIHCHCLATPATMLTALRIIVDDQTVRLPRQEVSALYQTISKHEVGVL
jgi:hypothetical protein